MMWVTIAEILFASSILVACSIDATMYNSSRSNKNTTDLSVELYNSEISNLNNASFLVKSSSEKVEGFVYKLGIASSTDCQEDSGYTTSSSNLQEVISVPLTGGDGLIKLCVLAVDKNNTKYELGQAVTKSWIKDTTPPTSSGNITSTATYASISSSPTFTWLEFLDANGIAKYQISIGTAASLTDVQDWTDINNVTSHQLSTLNLSWDNTYYVNLRAIDKAGNHSSTLSGSGWYTILDVAAPSNLINLNFSALSSTPLLKWTAPSLTGRSVDTYEVSLGTSPGLTNVKDWTAVGTATQTQFNSLSLSNGVMYYPSVRVKDNFGSISTALQGSGFRAVEKWKNTEPLLPTYIKGALIYAAAFQSDGKRLLGGTFDYADAFSSGHYMKLDADGNRDTGFVPIQAFAKHILQLSNGKIIGIGGGGSSKDEIYRFNADGTVDSNFNGGSHFTVSPSDSFVMVEQSDGKIVVGGAFTYFDTDARNGLLRLNADGTLDSSFDVGTGFDNTVTSIKLQSGNKLIVVGYFSSYNGSSSNCLVRLNSDGSLDTTFTPPNFDTCPTNIAMQSDGKIVAVGGFTTVDGLSRNRIVRLSANGSRDDSFTVGTGFNAFPGVVLIQPDNKIIVAGQFTQYNGSSNGYLIRLNENGSKDTSFVTGTGFSSQVRSAALLTDGNLIVGGQFTTYNFGSNGKSLPYIAKISTTGSLDTTFNAYFDYYVDEIQTTADNKIFVISSGNFRGKVLNRIARVKTDGTLDSTFNTGTGFSGASQIVYAFALQPTDQKIIVGGSFTTFNGNSLNNIARLLPSGAVDNSFTIGTGFSGDVFALALQNDGKVLVGGAFTSYDGTAINRIARLNADGTLDTSFSVGSGANNTVKAIKIQADGKILIGGLFTTYNGATRNRILRLNADGSEDTSLDFGTGLGSELTSIVLQPDGKLILGGNFTTYKGVATPRVIRLNTDATKDTTFNASSTLFNQKVYAMELQSDGQLLACGAFTSAQGKYLTRLNEDGSVDTSFILGSELANVNTAIMSSLAIADDGKILLGGNISGWNTDVNFKPPNSFMFLGW